MSAFIREREVAVRAARAAGAIVLRYYVQFTDARVDTGGLSGATPSEAVSWGKVDPDKLPDTVVCYCDSTIALPLLTAYALAVHPPRKAKRLYERRAALMENLVREYHQAHDFGPDGGLKPRP